MKRFMVDCDFCGRPMDEVKENYFEIHVKSCPSGQLSSSERKDACGDCARKIKEALAHQASAAIKEKSR